MSLEEIIEMSVSDDMPVLDVSSGDVINFCAYKALRDKTIFDFFLASLVQVSIEYGLTEKYEIDFDFLREECIKKYGML